MSYPLKLFKYTVNLNPYKRRFLLLLNDYLILYIAIFATIWITNKPDLFYQPLISIIYPIVGISFYNLTGHYKGLTTYTGGITFYRIGIRNFFLITIFCVFIKNLDINYIDLRFWITLIILSSVFIGLSRLFIRDLLIDIKKKSNKKIIKVAIYGAGDAGAQLANNLNVERGYEIKFFIDDNKLLHQRFINGIPIKSCNHLKINSKKIDKILFAIPSCLGSKRKKILNDIQKYNIPILQVPSIQELTSGKAEINALRPIAIEELLMRDPITPNQSLLNDSIMNKIILVTGAGGSIGGELSRQILKLKPKKLILLEMSEIKLYEIKNSLCDQGYEPKDLQFVLGNACNLKFIDELLKSNKVSVIFHCAAYKHVPLLESNPIQGIANNIFSTHTLCKAANNNKISKFIFISTDKAVRPTNVMGASKRLSELIVQAYARVNESSEKVNDIKNCKTCFSMVRFGNVLDSSGSVVPLFKKQISLNGPITVTHPEITRYFMTIQEAAQLVLQASTLAKGGEVFLLDMGKPVKIHDLALHMISLSGLKLKNSTQPDGDIEIEFTGLRPGEKLYEELLIDSKAKPTSNRLIFMANEKFIEPEKLFPKIAVLEDSILKQNETESLKILRELVPEWNINIID